MKAIWPPIFWVLLCFCTWFLLKETIAKPPPFPHFDKLLHASGFACLTFSGLKAYPSKPAYILAAMAGYGASTEVLQGLFTLSREASAWDWLADLFGVFLAYHAVKLSQKYDFRI